LSSEFVGERVVEELEGEVVVEFVVGSMVVEEIIVDFVDRVVGTVEGSIMEAFEAFVVDSVNFEEQGWMVRYCQHMGRLDILVGTLHGQPCRLLTLSFWDNCSRNSSNH